MSKSIKKILVGVMLLSNLSSHPAVAGLEDDNKISPSVPTISSPSISDDERAQKHIESQNPVKRVMCLSRFKNMHTLPSLERFAVLEWINISDTSISSFEGLSPLVNLEWLFANRTSVQSIEGSPTLVKLQHLSLTKAPITSFKGIEAFPNLKFLTFSAIPLVLSNEPVTCDDVYKCRNEGTPLATLEGFEDILSCSHLTNVMIKYTREFKVPQFSRFHISGYEPNPQILDPNGIRDALLKKGVRIFINVDLYGVDEDGKRRD